MVLSVAVAVMNCPLGVAAPVLTTKLALPLPSVVTVVDPIKVWPSPKPEKSSAVLVKNSILKKLLAVLLSAPPMVVFPPLLSAVVSTG